MTPRPVAPRVVALVAGLVVLWFVGGPAIGAVDNTLHDMVVRAAARDAPSGDATFVLVEIDDPSIEVLGRFPWSRGVLASVFERLSDAGAQVVALDVILSEPADADGDSALARALRQGARSVLATAVSLVEAPPAVGAERSSEESDLAPDRMVLEPIAPFLESTDRVGNIVVIPDDDGVLRRYPFVSIQDGDLYPSLAYSLLASLDVDVGAVPLDPEGTLLINWAVVRPSNFVRLSVLDVLQSSASDLSVVVQDRAIVVGATYTGGVDEGPTPVGQRTPYAFAHLYAAQTALSGRFVSRVGAWVPPLVAVLLLVGLSMEPLSRHPVRLTLGVAAAAVGTLVWSWALLRMGGTWLPPAFPVTAVVLFGGVHGLHAWQTHLGGQRKAEAFLRRFVGKDLAWNLPIDGDQHSVRAEVTILFWDLCDFTAFTNRAESEEVIDVLRTFGSVVIGAVEAHGGTVDKLLGDGVLAFWGYPDHTQDHARRAVETAMRIAKRAAGANEALAARGIRPFRWRMGIATGHVTIGEIGSESRADYTLIGRHVNLASRLVHAAPADGILIGASTGKQAGPDLEFFLQKHEPLQVKGFEEPVEVFLVRHDRSV